MWLFFCMRRYCTCCFFAVPPAVVALRIWRRFLDHQLLTLDTSVGELPSRQPSLAFRSANGWHFRDFQLCSRQLHVTFKFYFSPVTSKILLAFQFLAEIIFFSLEALEAACKQVDVQMVSFQLSPRHFPTVGNLFCVSRTSALLFDSLKPVLRNYHLALFFNPLLQPDHLSSLRNDVACVAQDDCIHSKACDANMSFWRL